MISVGQPNDYGHPCRPRCRRSPPPAPRSGGPTSTATIVVTFGPRRADHERSLIAWRVHSPPCQRRLRPDAGSTVGPEATKVASRLGGGTPFSGARSTCSDSPPRIGCSMSDAEPARIESCLRPGGLRSRHRSIPEMIRQAVDLAEGIENVRFEVADAEQLPFSDREFTAVLCSNSFHHYPDPLQAVREMARVLAPNGRLVIGDACADLATARVADRLLRWFEPGHVRLYRSTELGSFLHRAGLSQVMLRRLSGGSLAIVRGTMADRE